MPQGNLETLLSACAGGSSDGKIVCETLAAPAGEAKLDGLTHDHQPPEDDAEPQKIPPDSPPESFWLSKDAEYDWFDRNAFYERKESHKGNSAPNSTNLNPSVHPSSNSISQRFKKSKASIIGLPKPQKFVDAKGRRSCKAGNARLFPKRSGSVHKSDPPVVEPSSPKVSCIGRVRSKRDRSRRFRNRQKSVRSQKETEKPSGKRRNGLFAGFLAIFGSKSRARGKHEGSMDCGTVQTSDIRSRLPADGVDSCSQVPVSPPRRSAAEPIGLGGMMRFASGRRSDPLI